MYYYADGMRVWQSMMMMMEREFRVSFLNACESLAMIKYFLIDLIIEISHKYIINSLGSVKLLIYSFTHTLLSY